MKKRVLLIIFTALMLSVFAGCSKGTVGDSEDSSDPSYTLRFGHVLT